MEAVSAGLLFGITQIKNRIRKKRFFVTQKAVSVNFFEQTNSTQNKVSKKDNENLFKLEPLICLAHIGFKQLNLRV